MFYSARHSKISLGRGLGKGGKIRRQGLSGTGTRTPQGRGKAPRGERLIGEIDRLQKSSAGLPLRSSDTCRDLPWVILRGASERTISLRGPLLRKSMERNLEWPYSIRGRRIKGSSGGFLD